MWPMRFSFLLPVAAILAAVSWMVVSRVRENMQERRRREIIARGKSCEGRIVAIQRPGLLDSCTRLYFEFAPPGMHQALVGCHTEWRSTEDLPCELLSTGVTVKVRYLPERPEEAVIGKLVTS